MIFFLKRGIAKVTYKKYSLNYLWKQYNVESNTSNRENIVDSEYSYLYRNNYLNTIFALKVNEYSLGDGEYLIGMNDYDNVHIEDELSNVTISLNKDNTEKSDGSYRSRYLIKNATTTYVGYSVQDDRYRNRVDGVQYEVTSTTTYSRGSYIGTVTASSRSAYPTNGTSDNTYWYVYQGTIKGEEIETIQGLPGEYPEDGEQDGYWYVRQ